jgi:hypothetical protein
MLQRKLLIEGRPLLNNPAQEPLIKPTPKKKSAKPLRSEKLQISDDIVVITPAIPTIIREYLTRFESFPKTQSAATTVIPTTAVHAKM